MINQLNVNRSNKPKSKAIKPKSVKAAHAPVHVNFPSLTYSVSEPEQKTPEPIRKPNYQHPVDNALVAFGLWGNGNNEAARLVMGLLIACPIASVIPVACWIIMHQDLDKFSYISAGFNSWVLLGAFLGGLTFSATKVAKFIGKAFGGEWIGWGAAGLIEMSMSFTSNTYLSIACLMVLVLINVVSAASTLAKRH